MLTIFPRNVKNQLCNYHSKAWGLKDFFLNKWPVLTKGDDRD